MIKSSEAKQSKRVRSTKNALSKTELRRDCLNDKRRAKVTHADASETLPQDDADEYLFADLDEMAKK